MAENKFTSLLLVFSLFFFGVFAKDLDKYKTADYLRQSYQFSEAISMYESILAQDHDPLLTTSIQDKILECKNGLSLLNFAITPSVIASKNVPLDYFFLYFSQLENHSWIDIPNPLVKRGEHKYYKAIYFPESFKKLYFSAPDKSGNWNIYETELIEKTLWSDPTLILNLASPGDEIFPILSPDGKMLYFASNGHYGMGGYDLYVSKWDETLGQWGTPENLGFPFSSTEDDIFFTNTPDGQFSILASNRNLKTKNSIGIYVTEFSPAPIKTAIKDIAQIRTIAKLSPPTTRAEEEKALEKNKNNQKSEYSVVVAERRDLQVKHDAILEKQKTDRKFFKTLTNKEDKSFLQEIIKEREEESTKIRLKLEKATKKIQETEIEFLAKGIIPELEDPSITMTKQSALKEKQLQYSFHKLSLGEIRSMEIEIPVPSFDYSFKIQKESVFAENQALPNTLVYQIQLSTATKKALLKNFKGISPIYEKKLSSKKYIYTAGLFNSYAEAKVALSRIARRGFQMAFIVTFNQGKSIPLKEARILEKKLKESINYQVLLKNFPNGISSPVLAAIKESCDKEIAKTYMNGEIVYIVGPFEKESDAEYVITILSGLGIKGISIEPITL